MKFSDDNKQVKEFNDSNRLPFGISEVTIGGIETGETDSGKEYIEMIVLGPNDEEDSARVWFSSDAATNYSFNTLRQIYVHNAPENKKDAARDSFDAVKDTEEVVKLFNEKLIGGKCWFTKYYDPERKYVGSDGKTYRSVNKNILGYEQKLKATLMPQTDTVAPMNDDSEAPNAGKGIPNDW